MATKPTLQELLGSVPEAVLDSPCDDGHLRKLALKLTDWRCLAVYLNLEEQEVEDIEERSKSVLEKNIKMLRRWRKKAGERATYRCLSSILWELNQTDLVEKIRDLLLAPADTPGIPLGPPKSALQLYAEHLKKRYREHKPPSAIECPTPPTRKYFNLALIKKEKTELPEKALVRKAVEGNVSGVLEGKIAVELKDILSVDNEPRKVILIEGAAGSGKSTLSWHICQGWELGELFEEFSLVVFVQLRDPVVQRAQSIADLLPCPDEERAQSILSEMKSREGRGVLFVMDGWDELPPHLQEESIFRELIHPPLMRSEAATLLESAVIVTSRPNSSSELRDVVSSRIEIVGFTPTEVEGYFRNALKGDAQKAGKLLEQVRQSPVIESSCYLPLNVAIVVTLFLETKGVLPSTVTQLFVSLVMLCILRHLMKTRKGKKFHFPSSSLDHVPDVVRQPFVSLCHLAFQGILENKITFTQEDVEIYPGFESLSLLQAVESFACVGTIGTVTTYNFLHLSTQELLAAWHISKFPHSEQIAILTCLADHPRFTGVFRFYAGITKLQTPGIEIVIAGIIKEFKADHAHKDKLMILLNCLHEVQDPSLYQSVAVQLAGMELSFRYLSPVDSLSLGYFLPLMCHTVPGVSRCTLVYLDIQSANLFVKSLAKAAAEIEQHHNHKVTGGLNIVLWRCDFQQDDVHCITHLLESSVYICGLGMQCMYYSRVQHQPPSMRCVVEALIRNNSLTTLELYNYSLQWTHENGSTLCEMLEKNKTLERLYLECDDLSDVGALYIGKGLLRNTTLKELSLSECGITADGVKSLAEALMVNNSLEGLDLYRNNISDDGISHIAEALKRNTTLKRLNLSDNNISGDGISHIAEALKHNTTLKRLGLGDMTESGLESIAISLTTHNTLIKFELEFDLAAVRKRLWANGILQRLLEIAIERTVREFGEELTSVALKVISIEWAEEEDQWNQA